MKKDKSNPSNLDLEKELWEEGFYNIVGVDECGRGPWAGNVVAGAVIMPKDVRIDRLTDSKKLNKKEHKWFAEEVKKQSSAWGIGKASVEEIDRMNIKQASRLAMKRAIEEVLKEVETADFLLVDGNEEIDLSIPQRSVIKGDYYSHTISAAAIIAKVARDEEMEALDKTFGDIYGWKDNAGYQTKKHVEACEKFGLTEFHRKSWKPSKDFFDK